jgi:hypothetical protein
MPEEILPIASKPENLPPPTQVVSAAPGNAAATGFKATVVSDQAATPDTPESQLSKTEQSKEEAENRRTRLSSNLLEQKHSLIGDVGRIIVSVIVALYLIFGVTIVSLFMRHGAFEKDIPITSIVLIGMCGSIPTILSISLLVGLLAKEKEPGKDEKSLLDTSLIAKVCLDVVKFMKAPH